MQLASGAGHAGSSLPVCRHRCCCWLPLQPHSVGPCTRRPLSLAEVRGRCCAHCLRRFHRALHATPAMQHATLCRQVVTRCNACSTGTHRAVPDHSTGLVPAGNLRTSNRDGPYNISLLDVQVRAPQWQCAERTAPLLARKCEKLRRRYNHGASPDPSVCCAGQ